MAARLPSDQTDIVSASRPDYIDAIEVPEGPRLHWIWIFVALAFAIGMYSLGAKSQARSSKPALIGPIDGAAGNAVQANVVVHVAGGVHKPGVYEFTHAARVRDAVRQAGGPLPDADLNAINLAAFLEDGQKVVVPARATVVGAELADESTQAETASTNYSTLASAESTFALQRDEKPAASGYSSRTTTATGSAKAARPKKEKPLPEIPRATTGSGGESTNADPKYFEKNPLNLNTATAEQLVLLPGVGPASAAKILATRKEKGGFGSVDDLDEVPGIGPKKLEALRPLVTVG